MAQFGDLSASMKMRDVINKLVKTLIDKERPRYRYASVVSWVRSTGKCTVVYNGETNEVVVNMGSIQPTAVSQIVRIEGIGIDKYITEVLGLHYSDVPIGSAIRYYGTVAPAGYALANGQAVSRTANAELFTLIGVTYGSGDGSTTFNVPVLSGNIIKL